MCTARVVLPRCRHVHVGLRIEAVPCSVCGCHSVRRVAGQLQPAASQAHQQRRSVAGCACATQRVDTAGAPIPSGEPSTLNPQQLAGVPQEKRAAKQANEGGHAPGMELATLEQQQQQQQGLPHDADAAAQAAAEGAAVQGVLDGALPQVHQVQLGRHLGPSGLRIRFHI